MARIAVDIDDTLNSFTGLARQVIATRAKKTGKKIYEVAAYTPWDEWRTPADLLGMDLWLDVIAEAHSRENILTRTAFPDAVETVCALADAGHDLLYISNRRESAFEATADWLIRWGFPLHYSARTRGAESGTRNGVDTALVCTAKPKTPWLADCQYLIDDRPRTLFQFLSDVDWPRENPDEQRKAFALTAPYNRGLTDIPNLYLAPSWSLLNFYLTREGVLDGHRVRTPV